jgi:hypothetical protein
LNCSDWLFRIALLKPMMCSYLLLSISAFSKQSGTVLQKGREKNSYYNRS